jgi:tol-pal system protein YbgF
MCLRALLLLSVLIGCNSSYAALFEDKGARQENAAQQKQIGGLHKQGKVLEERITKLEEINNQALLGLHNQIEELRHDLNKLNGQIEVLTNEIGLSQNRQKDFYIDLDSRLRRIEQPDASADAKPNTKYSAATGGVPAKNVTVGTDDGNRDYQAAFGLFKVGKFKNAITKFKDFIKSYPKSELVPSAHYWIGNSYYALREFKSAISTQQELIKTFPDSAKAPDAMLNIASSQKEINYRTAAKKTLNDLIVKYPISDAAEKAKLRLAKQN